MRHLKYFTCRRRWEGDSWSSSAGGSDRSLVPGQSSRSRLMIILSKLLPPTLLMLAAMLGKERFIWADTERPLGEQRSFFEKIFSPWFGGWYVPQTLSESCARSQVPPANNQDDDNDQCSNDEKWQWWWWDIIAMMTIFVSINRPVDRGSYCSPTVRFVVTLLGEVRPGGDKMTVRLLMIIIIIALLPTSSWLMIHEINLLLNSVL